MKRSVGKKTISKHTQSIADAFNEGLGNFLLFILIIAAACAMSVMLFRPLDYVTYVVCPSSNYHFDETKTYYRRIAGETTAYFQAIAETPQYDINNGRPLPEGCTRHRIGLYLF